MKHKKTIYFTSVLGALIIAGTTGFIALYKDASKNNNPVIEPQNNEEKTEIYNPEIVEEPEDEIPAFCEYLLQSENDVLCFYQITNDEKVLIKNTNINPSILPREDLARLESGLFVSTLEEGYTLIEDFTS